MKRSTLALGLLISLASCGVIPLPTVQVPDQTIPVSQALMAGETTVYTTVNAGGATDAPVKNIRLSGSSQIVSAGGSQAKADIFIAPASLSGCATSGQTSICPSAQGELIGTMTLGADPTVFVLGPNERFGNAVKSGTVTIGVRLSSGSLLPGDQIKLTQMLVSARL